MSTPHLTLRADGLAKHFGGPLLFEDLSIEAAQGESLALTGPNGSGKSTLLQILWGFQRPTRGTAELLLDGRPLTRDERPFHAAFSAPYLGLPEYLTGRTLLDFHFAKRPARTSVEEMLHQTGLARVANTPVRHFSSGQKQRLRLALALYAEAKAYFLDEPCTNLDETGIKLYHQLVQPLLPESLVIIASNWDEEMSLVKRRVPVSAPVFIL